MGLLVVFWIFAHLFEYSYANTKAVRFESADSRLFEPVLQNQEKLMRKPFTPACIRGSVWKGSISIRFWS